MYIKRIYAGLVSTLLLCQTTYALFIPDVSATLYKRIINGFLLTNSLGTSAVPVIKVAGDGIYACGGTIISPKHILTAAHCVVQTKDAVSPTTNKVGNVNKITIHPEYFAQERNGRVDIAILELEDLDFSGFNQRVPIYDGPIGVEQTMLAVGWGQAEDGADNLSVLRGVLVMTGNKTMCGGESGEFVDNNGPQICTPGALTPYHSTCMGDSGSGLLVSSNNTLILVGVDSIARVSPFVHASYYMDFIMENTGLSREYLTGLSDS
ncbi:trypsin-like cysteine/serine peptidase domain-containing protein [Kickxella alabastrina]|uniref:trypsin-like cysteine/serine peptidase domain-containing protein n=1 Tax=Kickxella alabastrina TaxID=61397 RepID=UPI002220B392|nr:trypsin-like cysteine/serine peptidase domain-containing protein [Kickxella alabastrina]KAI7827353.1 trypsin-like cysteine/serine peptidase domain-containing protein [Kickxella alabastrina]